MVQVIKKEEAAAESAKDCKPTALTKLHDSHVLVAESQHKHAEESRAKRGSGFSSKQARGHGLCTPVACPADHVARQIQKPLRRKRTPKRPARFIKRTAFRINGSDQMQTSACRNTEASTSFPSHRGSYPALATNSPCSLQRRGQARMFQKLGCL